MCFMREWACGSWVHVTVPWLSQYSGVGFCCRNPSSSKRECSQIICHTQWEHARYSASQEERVTTTCCLELQVSGVFLHSIMNPETDLRPSDMAQSESVKDVKIGYGLDELP
jgi:hypothetical protein